MPNRIGVAIVKPLKWRQHFLENMGALGLPVPLDKFTSIQTTLATVLSLEPALVALGPHATLGEIGFCTTFFDKSKVGLAILASGYIGAVIGSAVVAAGKVIGESTTMTHVSLWLNRNHYAFLNVPVLYQNHREILVTDMINRWVYANKIKRDWQYQATKAGAIKAYFPY